MMTIISHLIEWGSHCRSSSCSPLDNAASTHPIYICINLDFGMNLFFSRWYHYVIWLYLYVTSCYYLTDRNVDIITRWTQRLWNHQTRIISLATWSICTVLLRTTQQKIFSIYFQGNRRRKPVESHKYYTFQNTRTINFVTMVAEGRIDFQAM